MKSGTKAATGITHGRNYRTDRSPSRAPRGTPPIFGFQPRLRTNSNVPNNTDYAVPSAEGHEIDSRAATPVASEGLREGRHISARAILPEYREIQMSLSWHQQRTGVPHEPPAPMNDAQNTPTAANNEEISPSNYARFRQPPGERISQRRERSSYEPTLELELDTHDGL